VTEITLGAEQPSAPRTLPGFLEANFEKALEVPRDLKIKRAPFWLRWFTPYVIKE
jgi:hypothetical protein